MEEGDRVDAINEMIKKLHWNVPQEEQQEAKKYILENIRDDQIYLLIQPLNKSYWDNAALLLKELGFPRVRPFYPSY